MSTFTLIPRLASGIEDSIRISELIVPLHTKKSMFSPIQESAIYTTTLRFSGWAQRIPLFYPVIKRSIIDVEILQVYKYTFSKISK